MHACFYFNYIIYYGPLIFCYQQLPRIYYSKFPRIDNQYLINIQDKLIKLQKCKIAFLYAIFRIKNLGFYKNASRKCH